MNTTSSASAFAVLLLAIAMLATQQLLTVTVQAEIQCSEAVQELTPCLDYLQGDEASPSASCCGGASALYAAASTRDDRQQACRCLKAAYLQYGNVLESASEALPGACGLGLSYAITPDIDCSTIP